MNLRKVLNVYTETIPSMSENESLSDRERELLRLVATGASNKEIAQKLSITTNTVKVHLRNIFAKTGVASRTEATLYAIRIGLVQVEGSAANAQTLPATTPALEQAMRVERDAQEQAGLARLPAAPENAITQPVPAPSRSTRRLVLAIAFGILLVIVILGGFALLSPKSPPAALASPAPVVASSRWQERMALPTARAGLGVAVYENQIYAIAGQTSRAITSTTSTVERYNPASNAWENLPDKPLAVTDVSAAVVGGRIYVPGGRTATDAVTDVLEIYDPKENQWTRGAALPAARCAYGLVAFEGKLYLFGGWDGSKYLASVYEYDPTQNTWHERAPMPTARGYAGAVVAGGKIFVIGGYAGDQALTANEEYLPDRDNGRDNPWTTRAPLPAGRYAMGVASVADIVYVVGSAGDGKNAAPLIEYFYQQDAWQTFESPALAGWSHLGLVPIERYLYVIGGQADQTPVAQNVAYQALYSILLPVIR